MSGERVLIVEDCRDLRREYAQYLRAAGEGYDITAVAGMDAVPIHLAPPGPDLVVLGCSFGSEEAAGLGPCRVLRRQDPAGAFAILVVATGLLAGQVCGAEGAGAQGCLRSETLSRAALQTTVRNLCAQVRKRRGKILTAGPITLCRDGRLLLIGSERFALSLTHFSILWKLAESPGILVRASDLVASGAAADGTGEARKLRKQVSRLRKKLGLAGRLIQTVWGEGYLLDLRQFAAS